MPEDRFVDLYVRMEGLNRRYATSPDSLQAGRAELFRAQGTSPEEIERTIGWYRQHPDRVLKTLEKIVERLEAEDRKQKGAE
jgi:DNA-binding transcriptional MerR regulator